MARPAGPVRPHGATEAAIAATGVRHTFLRHNMYADFVPFFATLEDGRAVIAAPAGEGRVGFVSRDDLADVAAAVLLRDDGDLDGAALDVTGPEALSMAEAAAVLGEVTGRPTEYRQQTVEEAWATRRPSGHPDWEVEGWVTSYLAIAAGELSSVTDVVPRLTGHPARTVAEHLRAHPADWAHLRDCRQTPTVPSMPSRRRTGCPLRRAYSWRRCSITSRREYTFPELR